jgi:hypothetical protein
MRRHLALCAFALFVASGDAPALAQAPVPPVVVDAEGLAIGGHDPVAYFTQGQAVQGSPAHEHRWNGATWRFATAAARDRFAADPEAFAPAYGGWCAWAMSEGRLAPGDPRVWRIVENRLYFNCSAQAQARWEADLDAAIARGDAHWARLRSSG